MLGGGGVLGLLSVRPHFCWGGVGAAKGLLPYFLVPKGNQPTACTLALWWLKFGPTGFRGGGGGRGTCDIWNGEIWCRENLAILRYHCNIWSKIPPDRGTRTSTHRQRWLLDACCYFLEAVHGKSAKNGTLKSGFGPSNTAAKFGTLLSCQVLPFQISHVPNPPIWLREGRHVCGVVGAMLRAVCEVGSPFMTPL